VQPTGGVAVMEVATGPGWALHCGDCLDPETGLASLGERSVDHVITDPPYSRDLYSRTRTNKGTGIRANGRPYRTSGSELNGNASPIVLGNLKIGAIDDILDGVAAELRRVVVRWVVVFSDIEISPRWRGGLGDWYLRSGIWVKPDAMPQVTGDRPAQGFETITIGHRPGVKRWNGGGKIGVWVEGTTKGDDRPDHPCPKPLALMQSLLSDFTDPGELVCDPFAGSATTAAACIRLGRRFIGWERDPKYFAVAVKRLQQTREQLRWEPVRRPKMKQQKLGLEDEQ
jgi:site-specific DNA-methyltransferase (adenine-specific)